jgi:hypothetical protein
MGYDLKYMWTKFGGRVARGLFGKKKGSDMCGGGGFGILKYTTTINQQQKREKHCKNYSGKLLKN